MTTLKTLALAAALALPAAGGALAQTSADMLNMGHSMLISQLNFSLNQEGYACGSIDNLTLAEVAKIQEALSDGDMTDSQTRTLVTAICDSAATR